MNIAGYIKKIIKGQQDEVTTAPQPAYDTWSETYDTQSGNLIMDLDKALFSHILDKMELTGKTVADIGCGTGRHWNKIYSLNPALLVGFDISEGMLGQLRAKYPHAQTYQLTDGKLAALQNEQCDVIVSTLTVAHIKNLDEALTEWDSKLKSGGDIIITDYHPATLKKGGTRSFQQHGKKVTIENHVHELSDILSKLSKMKYEVREVEEKRVDESVKGYYEQKNALHLYRQFLGTPIIYAIHAVKTNEAV